MCRYRIAVTMGLNGEARTVYRCQFNAPVVCNPTSLACWPVVPANCWCGQYKPVGEEEEPQTLSQILSQRFRSFVRGKNG